MKIFCVIPAHNEEKRIVEVVLKVIPLVDEVVIVNDGSKDNTYELAKTLAATTLNHAVNRGQGAALATGNEYARRSGADIVVHFDADGQFLAEEIRDIITPIISDEADIVFGSRFMGKESKIPWLKKTFIFPVAKIVNKFLFNIKTTDPQSGFRAMSRASLSKIIIENDGMAHCSEILYKAHQTGLRIKEVPTSVIYHEFGQKFSGGLEIIKELILRKLTN